MTKKQLELYSFIREFIERYGYCPSFIEMMEGVNVKSKSVVFRLLNSLEEQGRIRRLHNRNRAIEIVDNPELPVRGLTLAVLAREARRTGLVLCHQINTDGGVKYVPVNASGS